MIIAIDPGLMTGVAVWTGGMPATLEIYERENVYTWMNQTLAMDPPPTEVIVEDFQITQRTGELSKQYDALWLVGAIECLCFLYRVRLYKQSRSMKSFGTDFKLKHLGWYDPSRGGHQNDAQRHLLRHLVVHQRDEGILERLKEIL